MAAGEMPGIFVSEEKTGFFKKIGRKNIILSLALILILSGVGGYVFFLKKNTPAETVGDLSQPSETGNASVIQGLDTAPVSDQENLPSGADYQSENFRVGEISIGGEAEFLLSEDSPEPLEVSSIRGEAFTEKNKQEVKLVVTWRTNKLAKSTVSYSKGVGQAKKSIEEEDYSLNHSVIIPGLDQASTYVYDITSRDRFGGEKVSESHAVYTGSRTVSLFDLIANAVGEVFGWAVKKN
jgi:hypothetical protein